MTLAAAVQDLFKSVYELFASVIGTIAHIFQTFVSAILSLFTGLINMVADVFNGLVDVVGGVGRFVLGNIVVISVIAAGGYLYMRSRQQQGQPVVPTKKSN